MKTVKKIKLNNAFLTSFSSLSNPALIAEFSSLASLYLTNIDTSTIPFSVFCKSRGGRIRTCGPLVPNQVRYRTALRPEL